MLSHKQCGKEALIDIRVAHSLIRRSCRVTFGSAVGCHYQVLALLTRQKILYIERLDCGMLDRHVRTSRHFTTMFMDLREIDFTVQHRPGRQNVVADMLPRLSAAVLHQPH